jgi:hypothetical protein
MHVCNLILAHMYFLHSGLSLNPGVTLVHAIFYHGEALRRRVSRSVHLVRQLLHQHFQLVELGVAGRKVARP